MGPLICAAAALVVFLLAFCSRILSGLATGLLLDAFPTLSCSIVKSAARRMPPPMRKVREEEWLQGLASHATKYRAMIWALGCLWASLIIEPPLAIRYYKFLRAYHMSGLQGSLRLIVFWQTRYPGCATRKLHYMDLIAFFTVRALAEHAKGHQRAFTEVLLREQASSAEPEEFVRERARKMIAVLDTETLKILKAVGDVGSGAD